MLTAVRPATDDSFVSEANVLLSFSPAPADPQTRAGGPSDPRPWTRGAMPKVPRPQTRGTACILTRGPYCI